MEAVYEDFSAKPDPRWKRYVVGAGALEPTGSTLRFVVAGVASRKYSDAQIDVRRGSPQGCAAPPASASGTTPS